MKQKDTIAFTVRIDRKVKHSFKKYCMQEARKEGALVNNLIKQFLIAKEGYKDE